MDARRLMFIAGLIGALSAAAPAAAEDVLKLGVGQRGAWPAISDVGVRAGIFKKHNLALEIIYTAGGGETMQAVISGAVDIGVGIGTSGIMAAYAKGAPLRIIGGNMTGAVDLLWFVKANSPIKTMQDVKGHTFAYGSTGSSTQIVGKALLQEFNIDAKMVPTGNISNSLVAGLSGQVDVGWTGPPIYFDALKKGEIRILATGADAKKYANQTIRILAANLTSLQTKKDQIARYLDAYRETYRWVYSDDPAALKAMAAVLQVTDEVARQTRDLYPKENIDPDRIVGLDGIMADAIEYKFINTPLTDAQLKELVVPIGRK